MNTSILETTFDDPMNPNRSFIVQKNYASVVEDLDNVGKSGDTFLTQQGGKITQTMEILINEIRPRDEKRNSETSLLSHKQKEMKAIQDDLDRKRADFAKRMEAIKKKQEELKVKQKQLRDRVQRFDKFLRENDAKRQRALLKAVSERKNRELKEQELLQLQLQLQEEKDRREKMRRMIKNHKIYEQYLQSVVETLPVNQPDANEPTINDILMRHKTLVETGQELAETLQSQSDEIIAQQHRLAEMTKEKNDLVLVYNSQLGSLQKKLDKLKSECAYLEQKIVEREDTGKQKMRLLSETKLAISNIYSRIVVRNRNEQATLVEKLAAIQDRVTDLSYIAAKAESLMKEEKDKAKSRPVVGNVNDSRRDSGTGAVFVATTVTQKPSGMGVSASNRNIHHSVSFS